MTNSANNSNNSDALKWYFENEKNLTILAKGSKIGLIDFYHTAPLHNTITMATISVLFYPIRI